MTKSTLPKIAVVSESEVDSHLLILINHFCTIPKKDNGLTTMSAMKMYGITALSQRCGDLIRAGFPVEKVWKTGVNRRGKKVRYKEYSM